MKYLKTTALFLTVAAFLVSCNNDNSFYEEQTATGIDQLASKEALSARPMLNSDYGHELYFLDYYTILGFDFYPSNFGIVDNNDSDFISQQWHDSEAMDYNPIDGLVYVIGSDSNSPLRKLFSLDMDTSQVTEIAILSGNESFKSMDLNQPEPEYLGRAGELSFDKNGTLYIYFQEGKIMTYDLQTNEMEEFADLSSENYYPVYYTGLTYDFDHHRLLFSGTEYDYHAQISLSNISSIDCETGAIDELFSIEKQGYQDSLTSMEYIGNDKMVYFEFFENDDFYVVDLLTEEEEFIRDDNYNNPKDVIYIYNPDVDGDGVLNEDDPFPNSNMDESLSIGEYSFDIENQYFDDGAYMMDQIDALIAQINEQYDGSNGDALHRMFTRELSKITYYWYKSRLISRRERTAISRAANNANIPYVDFD